MLISYFFVLHNQFKSTFVVQVAATAGYDVTIVEINNQLVEQAQTSIKNSLSRVAKKQFKDDTAKQNQFVGDVLKRLNGSSDLPGVIKGTDLVIEAIVEKLDVKHKLFESIDKVSCVVCDEKIFLFVNSAFFYQMQRFLFVFSFFDLSWLNFEIIPDYNSYKNQTDKKD